MLTILKQDSRNDLYEKTSTLGNESLLLNV